MTMKLVGRKEECRILQTLFDSERPEFLALYGRRRVGKTFLIREFFKDKNAVFFNVTGSKNAKLGEQIDHFVDQLGKVFLGGIVPKLGKNWNDAFKILTNAILSVIQEKNNSFL